jgi:hypothetical protein
MLSRRDENDLVSLTRIEVSRQTPATPVRAWRRDGVPVCLSALEIDYAHSLLMEVEETEVDREMDPEDDELVEQRCEAARQRAESRK